MNKKEKRKIAVYLGIAIVAAFALISFASAEFWACFSDGQNINFCNPAIADRVCSSTLCRYCMSNYDASARCYTGGNFNVCNMLSNTCSLFNDGSNGSFDTNPPVLTFNSPLNNSLFTSLSVPFSFASNKRVNVYYTDLIKGRGRWSRVCQDCSSYSRARRFHEGLNLIGVRAIDKMGNEQFQELSFFIDSKEPRISKTAPKKGYADGDFWMQMQEENPKNITLHVRSLIDSSEMQSNVNISNCIDARNKKECSTFVDLQPYNGQTIEYWFSVEDIAGNKRESKHLIVGVDTIPPVFTTFDTIVSGSTVTFSIFTDEEVSLSYYDSLHLRPTWKSLCSRCMSYQKVRSFNSGPHNVTVKAVDKAGNIAQQNFAFII
jgi:hypothetical protein